MRNSEKENGTNPNMMTLPFISRVMRLTGIAVLAAVVIVSAGAGAVLADDNTPVAVGDGFEVTEGDVEELISYTKLASFRSTEKQHIMAAVRIKVFAEEAKALGLGQAVETGEKEKDTEVEKKTFGEQIKLSRHYIVKVLQDYPVSDLVIESYYRSHPDTIQEPLDEALKKRIRQKIVIAKRKAIIDQCFERLKEKYHVRFCDPEKGGCR